MADCYLGNTYILTKRRICLKKDIQGDLFVSVYFMRFVNSIIMQNYLK